MIKSPAMRFAGALVILTCVQAAAQSPADILQQIRERMTQNLLHLPDYTCRETIERTEREGETKHYRVDDRLRLDVAYVGGKELYAWPGADKFEDKSIADLVEGGAIGTGAFGGFAREVFSSMAPKFFWGGFVGQDGRRMVRMNFQVAREKSRYLVQHGSAQAVVAYRGFFEADPQTMLPVRFEIDAADLPAGLKLRAAGQVIQYGQMRIGDSQFLLPLTAEMWLERDTGSESRNTTHFDSCRQYSGESTVRFDLSDGETAAAVDTPIQLPAGLTFEAYLKEAIDYRTAARGDLVHALVASPVKHSGRIVIPRGALITARVASLGSQTVRSMQYFGIGLAFLRIEFAARRGDFAADVESAGVGGNFSVSNAREIYVKGPVMRLQEGTRLLLRTK